MKIREFARHIGVTHPAILKGCKSGRLDRSLTRDKRGRVTDIDPDVGEVEWRENAARQSPSDGDSPSLRASRARRENALAHLAEIELAEREGKLVDAQAIQSKIVTVFTNCRNRLLGIPSKLKQRRPEMTLEQIRIVDDCIRETLEELAEGEKNGGKL